MPELPDVEKYRRVAERTAGQTVQHVSVPDPGVLEGSTPQGIGRSLKDRVLDTPERHGKWLILRTVDEGPGLVCHFGMTGSLLLASGADEDDPPGNDAVVLECDRDALIYRTQRRLGKVAHVQPGRDHHEVTGPLGRDAVELDRSELQRLLAARRGGFVKSVLLDQEVIAGLGNELIDEMLWRSGLHPRRTPGDFEAHELDALHRAMHAVLDEAIDAGQVPSGRAWLNAHRGDEHPRCPHCGEPLQRAEVGGRTTVWCPSEQPEVA